MRIQLLCSTPKIGGFWFEEASRDIQRRIRRQEFLGFHCRTLLYLLQKFACLLGRFLFGWAPDYKARTSATFSSSLKINRHEDVVARAERGLVFCGCFGPSYIILVSPGMDLAMAVLLVAIFDDFRPRDKSSKL
ncbi:hypothetical protein GOP47_0022075 [Adiantum capillus-veneris]|uniref:Uncharacterized protein n=1 Tax=Adiantum capillus-veneris TaxID=13818 RepID=A0A9D4U9L2_ADICA|nr:hypothetical protein GOP47_0022075 [Adiantum capillus-veneris]